MNHHIPKCWLELFGAGDKTAPIIKQNIWPSRRTEPIMASFRPLMFSMIAPAILTPCTSENH